MTQILLASYTQNKLIHKALYVKTGEENPVLDSHNLTDICLIPNNKYYGKENFMVNRDINDNKNIQDKSEYISIKIKQPSEVRVCCYDQVGMWEIGSGNRLAIGSTEFEQSHILLTMTGL